MQFNFEAVATLADKYALKGVLWACSKWAEANKDSIPDRLPSVVALWVSPHAATTCLHLAALCSRLGMKAGFQALWPLIKGKAGKWVDRMVLLSTF